MALPVVESADASIVLEEGSHVKAPGDPRLANVLEERADDPVSPAPFRDKHVETERGGATAGGGGTNSNVRRRSERTERTDALSPTDRQRTMLIIAMFSDLYQTLILRSMALLKRVGNTGQCPRMIDLLRHYGWAGLVVRH